MEDSQKRIKPKYSIVIANYNYEKYIAQTLDSCFNQDFPAEQYEVVMVDDGSKDTSPEIASKYLKHKNFKLIRKENGGQGSAFVHGVAEAEGDFICLLDSDDYFHPDKLKLVDEKINSFEKLSEYFFLCHDVEIYDEQNSRIVGKSWFQNVQINEHAEYFDIGKMTHHGFPFAVPAGQVFSSKLLKMIMNTLPVSNWIQGVDNAIAHAAMIIAEGVHYLHKKPAVYRIHAGNNFASFDENDEILSKINWRIRFYKFFAYAEQLINSLDINFKEKQRKLEYLQKLKLIAKISSQSERFNSEIISYIILCTPRETSKESIEQTINSIQGQGRTLNSQVIILAEDNLTDLEINRNANPNSYLEAIRLNEELNNVSIELAITETKDNFFQRLKKAYELVNGDYITILMAGDVLDKNYLERHLYFHQFKAICLASTCSSRPFHQNTNFELSHDAWFLPPDYTKTFSLDLKSLKSLKQDSRIFFRHSDLIPVFLDEFGKQSKDYLSDYWNVIFLQYLTFIGGRGDLRDELLSSKSQQNKKISYPNNFKKIFKFYSQLIMNNRKIFEEYYSQSMLKAASKLLKS